MSCASLGAQEPWAGMSLEQGHSHCSLPALWGGRNGAPEVPWAVPMSQVGCSHPGFPSAFQNYGAQRCLHAWKDAWLEGDWGKRGFRIMGARPAVFSHLFGS